MDNLIFEKLGYRQDYDVYGVKVTGFNERTCMSVQLFMTAAELKGLARECRDLLNTPILRQWGQEEGQGDHMKLMVQGSGNGSAELRLFMKAELRPDWSDTGCFALDSKLSDMDAFGAGIPSFMEGEDGCVLALVKDIRF